MNATGMGLGMWLFWIILIAGVVVLLKLVLSSNTGGTTQPPSAIDTLKQRYARGEIDDEEFERMKHELKK